MNVLDNTKKVWELWIHMEVIALDLNPFVLQWRLVKYGSGRTEFERENYFDSGVYFPCMCAQGQENGGLGSRLIDKDFFSFRSTDVWNRGQGMNRINEQFWR